MSPGEAPLKAVFFLVKASENRLERACKAEAARLLLPRIFRPLETKGWWDKMLVLVNNIVEETPCYMLHFDESGRVVELLNRF